MRMFQIDHLFRSIGSLSQLSIYGAVSNCCEQFGVTEDEKGQERTFDKGEIRDLTNTKEREFTRSELFCNFSKTSIRKQFAGKHSGLRITVRD